MFKKSSLAITALVYGPVAMGALVAIREAMRGLNAHLVAAIFFYTFGFVLFAVAKVQNIRKGYLVSFGSAQMSGGQRFVYRLGYFLMAIGFLLTIALSRS